MKAFIKRHKKMLISVLVCTAVALLLVGFGYTLFLQEPKTVEIDMVFDAVKLDGEDRKIGTVEIHITGQRQDYIFREDVLKLNIENFDGYENIRQRTQDGYVYFQGQRRGCVYFEADHIGREYTETLRLYFTEDFSRVVIPCLGGGYYIGSGNGKYTAQECLSYIENNKEDWDYVESSEFEVQMEGVWMDSKGKEGKKETVYIRGYLRDYLFGKDIIYIETDRFGDLVNVKSPENSELRMLAIPDRNIAFGLLGVSGHFTPDNALEFVYILLTDEYDRFICKAKDNTAFFVGSVSGKYTPREIVEYFEEFTNTDITLPEE